MARTTIETRTKRLTGWQVIAGSIVLAVILAALATWLLDRQAILALLPLFR